MPAFILPQLKGKLKMARAIQKEITKATHEEPALSCQTLSFWKLRWTEQIYFCMQWKRGCNVFNKANCSCLPWDLSETKHGFMKEYYDKKYFIENATVGTDNHLLRRAVYSGDWHCFVSPHNKRSCAWLLYSIIHEQQTCHTSCRPLGFLQTYLYISIFSPTESVSFSFLQFILLYLSYLVWGGIRHTPR